METSKILVVEDDKPVRNLITTTLRMHGYTCLEAAGGSEAVMMASSHLPSIVLLDLGLPDMDGMEVIRQIRSWSSMPILVISARSDDRDKIDALDLGEGAESPLYSNAGLKIDYSANTVFLNGTELHLTQTEYRLLCLLAQNTGKVLTYNYITRNIWGSSWENNLATLRVVMTSLRRKLRLCRKSSLTMSIEPISSSVTLMPRS